MSSSTADPILNPSAYQQLLLRRLGDDDPETVQAETTGTLRALVAEAGADLRTRPASGEWSVIELLGHILDAEIVWSTRYRWVLAEDDPPLMGYDQDRWVSGLQHARDDPDELIELFDALRRANLRLWRQSTPQQRARTGVHAERGPESFELMFQLIAGHGRVHVDQMQGTLEAIRAGGRAAS